MTLRRSYSALCCPYGRFSEQGVVVDWPEAGEC